MKYLVLLQHFFGCLKGTLESVNLKPNSWCPFLFHSLHRSFHVLLVIGSTVSLVAESRNRRLALDTCLSHSACLLHDLTSIHIHMLPEPLVQSYCNFFLPCLWIVLLTFTCLLFHPVSTMQPECTNQLKSMSPSSLCNSGFLFTFGYVTFLFLFLFLWCQYIFSLTYLPQ